MKKFLFLALFLPACALGRAAENEPLDQEKIAQLRAGTTTSKEVVELLGAPVDIVQLGHRSAYLYKHIREKSTGIVLLVFNALRQDQRQDRLWVFFDEKGTLTHFGSTFEAENTQIAWPLRDIYKKDEAKTGADESDSPADDSTENMDKGQEPAK